MTRKGLECHGVLVGLTHRPDAVPTQVTWQVSVCLNIKIYVSATASCSLTHHAHEVERANSFSDYPPDYGVTGLTLTTAGFHPMNKVPLCMALSFCLLQLSGLHRGFVASYLRCESCNYLNVKEFSNHWFRMLCLWGRDAARFLHKW